MVASRSLRSPPQRRGRRTLSTNVSSISPRCSRRLNILQRDGSPVRRSRRFLSSPMIMNRNSRRRLNDSIRIASRVPSRSRHRRNNTSYSSNYRQTNRNILPDIDANRNNDNDDSDTAVNVEDNIIRICYCDLEPIPSYCNECNHNLSVPCSKHEIIFCSNDSCSRKFHVGCLKTYLGINIRDRDSFEYNCIECTHDNSESIPWNNLTNISSKLRRLGLPPDKNENHIAKTLSLLINECKVPLGIVNNLKNNDPSIFPSITPMSMEMKEKHVDYGRKFEVSMLMFSSQKCDCCGRVQPYHVDPCFPTDAVFQKKHFNTKFHNAWHCKCDGFCCGSQYYGYLKRNEITVYKDHHNGKAPWEVLNVERNAYNAKLCHMCYNEIPSNKCSDLQFARSFSFRNGFGQTHIYPPFQIDEDINITKGRRLQFLLSSFTAVEEAAIRQITPLISLVRLSTGSISSKGNTSCLWQNSSLNLILPNLPSECKYILITRQSHSNSESGTKSTKFERKKIEEALCLLSDTVEGVWKNSTNYSITISQERLNAWPPRGDIFQMDMSPEVIIENDNNDGHNFNPDDMNLNSDKGDIGPAPLQNTVNSDEEFEGIINFEENAHSSNALMYRNRLNNVIRSIRSPYNHDNRQSNETYTFQQSDVLNLEGFCNMNTTPFAWSRAFPTIFIPI